MKLLAFTLVEMILVIILLGILSAIALPKYFDLQKEAMIARYTQDKRVIDSQLEQLLMKWRMSGGSERPGQMDYNLTLKVGDKSVKYTHYGWPIRIANVGEPLDVDVYHNSAEAQSYVCADIFRFLLNSEEAVEAPCDYEGVTAARYCAQLAPDELYVPGFAYCALFPKYDDCLLPVMQIHYEMDQATLTYTGTGGRVGDSHRQCTEEEMEEQLRIGKKVFHNER